MILAVVNFFICLPLSIIMLIPELLRPAGRSTLDVVMIMLLPLFYLVASFLLTLFGTWVYNNVARKMGGIEFTLSDSAGTNVP